jgi:signal transduction histidine kinase
MDNSLPTGNSAGKNSSDLSPISSAAAESNLINELRTLTARLEQQVAAQAQELSALYEVSAVASQYLDLKTMLTQALERALATLRSEVGLIYLAEETRPNHQPAQLNLVVHQGLSPNMLSHLDHLPADKGVAGWILKHHEPMLFPNLIAGLRDSGRDQPTGSVTCLFAPMRARGQVIGLIGLLREPNRSFSLAEVSLLASIADQVGLAVDGSRLRQLAERTAILEERHRLARDLHDSVTQQLYGLILFAKPGQKANGSDALTGHFFNRIVEIAEQAIEEIRQLIHQLYPPSLAKKGLAGALQQRLDTLEEQAGLKTHLLAQESLEMPAPVAEALYYIAQESLNNALKHAAASSVSVYLRGQNEHVELEVKDDGCGFDPATLTGQDGLGLANMQERARSLGGSLQIRSALGQGTTVKVWLGTYKN